MAGDGPGDRPVDVLDSMAVGYLRLGHDWRVVAVNPVGEQILERRPGVLPGRDFWAEFPDARELEFGRVCESVMHGRVPLATEAYYPGLDTWFELRVQPSDDGGIAVWFLDISARRLADERLAQIARQGEVRSAVSTALGEDLDVAANVGVLARLVVPELATWSIVSLVGDDGRLVDTGSWHLDPARRAEVALYAETRLAAYTGEPFADRAVRTSAAITVPDAARAIHDRMRPGVARDVLDALDPASCLLVPMVARGRTVGLLSLYADAPPSAAQVALAHDVADRAALAIDNSASYERARAARAEAEAAGQRLALLARASEALAVADDLDQALRRLAALVVPQLADWSIVTVLDDDGVAREVGVAHRDPERVDAVAEYARRRTSTMTPDSPLATALRTGAPVVVDALSEAVLVGSQADPDVLALARTLEPHGVVVAPLVARGQVLGAFTFVTSSGRGPHRPAEVDTALDVANRAAVVLDSARSAFQARRLAESVQRSMLGIATPGPGLEVATRYRAAYVDRQVGGDWYDTFRRPDGPTVVTIGDVMGHDVAAISAMAQLRTVMRATAWSMRHSPAEVLRTTDEISAQLGPGTFATVVTADVLPAADGSAVMRWSNAGHLPPAVIDPDGTVTLLQTDAVDVPLGVVAGSGRRDHQTVLAPGATVVLYTDGLIERRGEDYDARLLDLCRALRDLAHEDLDTLLEKLLVDLAGATGHADDVALIALRVTPR